MSPRTKALFAITFLIKIIIALFIPLTLDEYYYLVWGQNPRLSYFDHPPMVGWLMVISTYLKDLSPGAIRWPFLLLSHGSIFVWYLILKDYLKEHFLFCFTLVAVLNPLWGVGSFIATPDIPLIFFWSCSILVCYKLLNNNSAWNYMALGTCLGLGFLSKYQIVLFIPCLILFIYYQGAQRILFNKKTVVSILFGFIFSFPVLIWNYHHDWISFQFQWNHGMSAQDWNWLWPPEYLLSQLLLVFPLFFIIAFRNYRKSIPLKGIAVFSVFPFLFFFYTSFKSHVEANWPVMAYPSLYALAFVKMKWEDMKWVNKTLVFWFVLFLLAMSLLFFPKHEKLKKIKLFEANKYNKVLEFAKKHQPVLPFNYQMTSYLSFQLKQSLCKFPNYGRMDFYNFKKSCQSLPDHFYYIVTTDFIPPIEKDYPDYKVLRQENIDETHIVLEVQKK